MRQITLLGSTGSIGENTLDLVRRHPDRYRVLALCAHRQWEKLRDQCRESGLVIELPVLLPGGSQAQVAGDGEERNITDIAEVSAVDPLYLPPLRVQVGLGQDGGDVR